MFKSLDPIQLFILLLAAIILTIGLIYIGHQSHKQKRLMKKEEPDRDIREPWPTDFQHHH